MNTILDIVENIIEAHVVKIEQRPCKNVLKKVYRIIDDNEKRYCVKRINIMSGEFNRYKKITCTEVNGFVHVYDIVHVLKRNEYVIVMDWIEGMTPNLDYWNIDKISCEKMISVAAYMIRNIHEVFKTDAKFYCNNLRLRKALDYKFLSAEQQEVLYNYIANRLVLLNERQQTVIHGDLHVDNICGTPDRVCFLDLDDVDYGDAYKDLVYASNIHKSREEDIIYYTFLKAYFNNIIPNEFWPIVNCYSIFKILNIMDYEIAQSDVGQARISIDTFINEHDKMQSDVPHWFRNIERKMTVENESKK